MQILQRLAIVGNFARGALPAPESRLLIFGAA